MRVSSLIALGLLAFSACTHTHTHALGLRANGRGKGKAESSALTEAEVSNSLLVCSNLLQQAVFTTDTYGYSMHNFEIPPSQTNFVFNVQAKNDAHILLAENADGSGGVYEIVIGGWGNTQSVIRKAKQSNQVASGSSNGALSGTQSRPFWVSWSQGFIALGSGQVVGSNIIVSYQDPNPTLVRYAGFSTGWGSSGTWTIPDCAGDFRACGSSVIDQTLYTNNGRAVSAEYGPYQMMPYDISLQVPARINFVVQAANDAHILLADTITGTGNIYEIVLSGWSNTKSVIRKGRQGADLATAWSNGALSATEPRTFWVGWANGRIALGRGAVVGVDEIVAYQDPNPTLIKYAGFSTGFRSAGLWGPVQCAPEGRIKVDAHAQRSQAPMLARAPRSGQSGSWS